MKSTRAHFPATEPPVLQHMPAAEQPGFPCLMNFLPNDIALLKQMFQVYCATPVPAMVDDDPDYVDSSGNKVPNSAPAQGLQNLARKIYHADRADSLLFTNNEARLLLSFLQTYPGLQEKIVQTLSGFRLGSHRFLL